jgi:hypothetical protein
MADHVPDGADVTPTDRIVTALRTPDGCGALERLIDEYGGAT